MPKHIGSIVTLWDSHNFQGKKPAPAIFCDQDQCRGFARLYSIAGVGSKWREYHFKCQKCGHCQKITTGEKPPNCQVCDCRPCVCEKPKHRLGIKGHEPAGGAEPQNAGERSAWAIDCPHCGARKGEPCTGRVDPNCRAHAQRGGIARALEEKRAKELRRLHSLASHVIVSSGWDATVDEARQHVEVRADRGETHPYATIRTQKDFTSVKARWLASTERSPSPTRDELDTFKHYGIEAPQ